MTILPNTQDLGDATPVKSGFRLDVHDRLLIHGKPYRFLGMSGDNAELIPASGAGMTEVFPMGALARLSASGDIKHEVGYYLPDDLKPASAVAAFDFQPSNLVGKARVRFDAKLAQIKAIEDMEAEGILRPNKESIEAARSDIEKRAEEYFKAQATERDLIANEIANDGLPDRIRKGVRQNRGGGITRRVGLFSADYLRKLFARYKNEGVAALADDLSKSGNRTSPFRPEEQALLTDIVNGSYLTPERKSIKATVADVKRGFQAENERRDQEGLSPLRVPGRDAVRRTIKKLDRLTVLIARFGREEAMKKLRPVGKGLEVSRPGERVEMDEWCIDLLSIIRSAKLETVFGEEHLKALGLDGEKARWWLVAAIDCRTRICLGMKLTRNPSGSAARECLRMVVSDKGQWSDSVRACCAWSHAVVPEVLATDNGPGFKSRIFQNACLDLQMVFLRTIGGIPGMRGAIERLFHTAALGLMPRLVGRTFSNPRERGDYPAEDRACLDAEDVAFALVRWIVDIYHNTPHEGLGGRTPLEQWDADMESGNYPLRALPDARSKRLAFGNQVKRTVTREGITVMGIRYHSEDLALFYMQPGSKQVDVSWDQTDLGAIEVYLDGAWREVPAVHDRFRGLNLHVWLRARRALRAKSASRRAWEEEVVFKAIDDIEDLATDRSIAFGIVDTSISEKRLKEIESELFGTFRITETQSLRDDGQDAGREITPREPDPDRPVRTTTPRKASDDVPATPDVQNHQDTDQGPAAPGSSQELPPVKPATRPRTAWVPRKPKEDDQ
ncbi:Mu transposase C-terminal domain-containing protein [Roseovarius bejariae]|nr:Mu transposase C-terminal domain-containing protein [Roseovarius bejariae]